VTCMGGRWVGCPGGVVVRVVRVRPGCSFAGAGSRGISPRADAVSLIAGSAPGYVAGGLFEGWPG
jgi:hypothetical protein